MHCFDLYCRNSIGGALSVQALFICNVSMTTLQTAFAMARTKTSIILSSHCFHPFLCGQAASCS